MENQNENRHPIRRTAGFSELTEEERLSFCEEGCEEGYEWWLRQQGLLTTQSALDGERDYPPYGYWYKHIDEYHAWMNA